jgi:hypothetical protein
MDTKRARFMALAAAAVLAAGAGLASADTDLTWIGQLPGVSLRTSKAARAGPKAVYTLSGDVDAAMASVRDGLAQRRWTMVKSGAPAGEGAAARTVVADKDGTRVKIVGSSAKGTSNLTVTVVRGLGTSGPAR